MLAKSVTPSRIEENMNMVELSQKDMEVLNSISKQELKRFVHPEFGVNFGFPDKQ